MNKNRGDRVRRKKNIFPEGGQLAGELLRNGHSRRAANSGRALVPCRRSGAAAGPSPPPSPAPYHRQRRQRFRRASSSLRCATFSCASRDGQKLAAGASLPLAGALGRRARPVTLAAIGEKNAARQL